LRSSHRVTRRSGAAVCRVAHEHAYGIMQALVERGTSETSAP
jgi:hypothetical protein